MLRRRFLYESGGGGESSYISGLHLHLDGIDNTRSGHSSSVDVWEDISGNQRDFTKLSNSASLNFNDNSFYGTGSAWMNADRENVITGLTDFTIECCFKFNKSINYDWALNNAYFTAGSFWRIQATNNQTGQGLRIMNSSSSGTWEIPFDTVERGDFTTFSSTFRKLGTNSFEVKSYANGVLISTNTIGYNINTNTKWWICGNQGQSGNFNGNIYSVRFYDKVLTDSEVANNFQVDLVRFN